MYFLVCLLSWDDRSWLDKEITTSIFHHRLHAASKRSVSATAAGVSHSSVNPQMSEKRHPFAGSDIAWATTSAVLVEEHLNTMKSTRHRTCIKEESSFLPCGMRVEVPYEDTTMVFASCLYCCDVLAASVSSINCIILPAWCLPFHCTVL